MASHHGCLKPHLHLSPLLFATYSITTGLVPLDWKSSFIVPVPKSSPPSDSPSNYIGLSLSFVSSVNFLKSIFTPFSLIFVCLAISSHPSNLVSSLNAQLPLLCSFLLTPFFLSSNLMFLSVASFLISKKAFDSVSHQPLLVLLSSFSLPPDLLNWIHSYLLNRSQSVVVCGSTSSSLLVSSGVPQGSILGPLLFLVYIKGVTDIPLSVSSHLSLYADDIFLFHPISSQSDMCLLQTDLDSISSWLSSHLLQLNSSKSKYIIFSHKPPSYFDVFPSLSISSTPIECVAFFRYLGVLLSSYLSWAPHISSICCKSCRILGLTFRHFHPHSFPSIYYHQALCLSYLSPP